VSSGECTTSIYQEFVEDFGWFESAECLSWTIVEFVGDGVEFGLRVARQVGSFGEILTQESVGVFVATALPGCVWVTEVDIDSGLDGEARVLGHLFSLVPGHTGVEEVGKGFHFLGQEEGDTLGDSVCTVPQPMHGLDQVFLWPS
jgi:hypothetical protein